VSPHQTNAALGLTCGYRTRAATSDTDSVMIYLSLSGKGKPGAAHTGQNGATIDSGQRTAMVGTAMTLGREAAAFVSAQLPPPMKLEFEKVHLHVARPVA
jgi:hypothetical protein